jgi:hypothetical protein
VITHSEGPPSNVSAMLMFPHCMSAPNSKTSVPVPTNDCNLDSIAGIASSYMSVAITIVTQQHSSSPLRPTETLRRASSQQTRTQRLRVASWSEMFSRGPGVEVGGKVAGVADWWRRARERDDGH